MSKKNRQKNNSKQKNASAFKGKRPDTNNANYQTSNFRHQHKKKKEKRKLPRRADKYYAVRVGRVPGIYRTWKECKEQTDHFSGCEFKSFLTLKEAEDFMNVPEDVLVELRAEREARYKLYCERKRFNLLLDMGKKGIAETSENSSDGVIKTLKARPTYPAPDGVNIDIEVNGDD